MNNKKVVVLGGGTGLSTLLRGLKLFPLDITAVVSVSDDGRSTGRLREEFNTIAVGDIRQVITALSETEPLIEKLMNYRFKTTSDLNGHPVGNLILTALSNISGNISDGIESLSKIFNLKGKVLPLTEDNVTLVAEMTDGKVVVASHFVDGGNVIYKLPNGNYSFELYVVTNGKIGAIRRVNVAVSDSQVTPTFTKKEQSISKAGTAAACFEFKFDGQTQSNIAVASSTTNGYGADKTFIKTINVTISVAADNGSLTGTYTIPVTVNTLLDK